MPVRLLALHSNDALFGPCPTLLDVLDVRIWFPQSRRVEATEETGLHAKVRTYILICVTCTSSPSPRSVPSIHALTLEPAREDTSAPIEAYKVGQS